MAPRKTLVAPVALTMLAALIFTGCGEQKTGSIPEPSASSNSATVSSTGTASESGDAAEHYSDGSKAPEGEYRPADEQGPAQNVPKPVEPEGMNEETAEGLEQFIGYWIESINYGTQTGDFTYVIPLVNEKHTADIEYFAWTENLYRHGGWKTGGLRSAILGDGPLTDQGEGVYTLGGKLLVQDSYTYFDGEMNFVDNSASEKGEIFFTVEYKENRWSMVGVELTDGQN